jgi:hypothetical protein
MLIHHSRCLQPPRLSRLVRRKFHRWCPTDQRRQQRRPRLRRHPHNILLHVSRYLFWLQNRPCIRILVLDPYYHRFHHRPRCLCSLWGFRQHSDGCRYQ